MAGWAAGEAGAVRSGVAGSVAGAATEAQGVGLAVLAWRVDVGAALKALMAVLADTDASERIKSQWLQSS